MTPRCIPTALVALYWPRTYTADVRILAEQNLVLPALGNPNRAVPRDADKPTRNVADMILRRDNVIALIRQESLVERWDDSRPPVLRLKDKLLGVLAGRLSPDDKLRAIVAVVEKRLVVATDETSVTITVEWTDPQTAYALVKSVERSFLDARYDSNAAVIGEAIALLEQRAKAEAPNVDGALAELVKVENETKPTPAHGPKSHGRHADRATILAPRTRADGDAGDLADVRLKIRRIDEEQQRRIAEAVSQLIDAQSSLGPLHPTLVALEQKVRALEQPPRELVALRSEERGLVSRLAGVGTRPRVADPNEEPREGQRLAAGQMGANPPEDGPTARARAKLLAATSKYNDVLGRIEAAQMERDVSRAAFKYKYSVIRPPEIPRSPKKPKVALMIVAGGLSGVILSFLLAGASVLSAGYFVEPWQVSRRLKLPLLGSL